MPQAARRWWVDHAPWIPDPVHGVLATLRADRYGLTSPLEQLAALLHEGDEFAETADQAAALLRITGA